MKIAFAVFLVFVSLGSYADKKSQIVLEETLGRILVKHDRAWRYTDGVDPYQFFDVVELIRKEYKENISALPIEFQSDFYWTVYEHVHLGSHDAEDIIYEMYNCCPDEILRLIETYITSHTKLHGADGRVKLWQGVQQHLNTLKKINHEKP